MREEASIIELLLQVFTDIVCRKIKSGYKSKSKEQDKGI